MTRRAIGTITPSSNRTVEATLAAVMPYFPAIDSVVARIPYYGAAEGQPADGYDIASFRQAAWLLSHAAVEVVCWNGSRGAALGLPMDAALVAEMSAASGLPGTTTALAAATLLQRLGARRIGLVTPGPEAYAAESGVGFAALGIATVGVRGLGITNNLAAAEVPPAETARLAREVAAAASPDAILLWSTNLPGWSVMAALEAELGIPVLDSAAIGIWACLAALAVDMKLAAPLGRLFTIGQG